MASTHAGHCQAKDDDYLRVWYDISHNMRLNAIKWTFGLQCLGKGSRSPLSGNCDRPHCLLASNGFTIHHSFASLSLVTHNKPLHSTLFHFPFIPSLSFPFILSFPSFGIKHLTDRRWFDSCWTRLLFNISIQLVIIKKMIRFAIDTR
jgi:hypothetical protein